MSVTIFFQSVQCLANIFLSHGQRYFYILCILFYIYFIYYTYFYILFILFYIYFISTLIEASQ